MPSLFAGSDVEAHTKLAFLLSSAIYNRDQEL